MDLKTYLDEQERSEPDFAKAIGTSHAAVNRYVRKQRIPRPAIMREIERETGGKVTPADFYRRHDDTAAAQHPVGNLTHA